MRIPHLSDSPTRLVVASLCTLIWIAFSHAGPEDPTHEEVEMITFDIGESGRLETMAMTPAGELLASVTWLVKKPDARGAEPRTTDPNFWDYRPYFLGRSPKSHNTVTLGTNLFWTKLDTWFYSL